MLSSPPLGCDFMTSLLTKWRQALLINLPLFYIKLLSFQHQKENESIHCINSVTNI